MKIDLSLSIPNQSFKDYFLVSRKCDILLFDYKRRVCIPVFNNENLNFTKIT